ncbi:MAG TPA: outer membrane beta-barrel protein [Saprospiraceae bacterium]|nr:outer membrane beta-barrel protein [Saprospiraceae bacterium]HMQ81592.1 outer membrane beta-barrel protein [Saprospiraceae bacterium]
MQKSIFFAVFMALLAYTPLAAQIPQGGFSGGGGNFDPSKMQMGQLYGKIVDEAGKGVGFATVQLFGKKFNPQNQSLTDTLWAAQLTEDNGDFNLEKLPVVGEFELVISFLGYTEIRQKVDFGIKPPQMQPGSNAPAGPPAGGSFPGAGMGAGNFVKDLGNIKLLEGVTTLNEVVVTGQASTTTLALDRKSYRVDKDLTSAGGTAQDALKNVPSLSVDLDGNVTLRNGSPQIFIDGRPTTLSLDQIPAADIESVEVITNPSAKFDAGGGAAGIVNIVLKKEKRVGYNGNIRVGGDSQGGYNFGGDINARQGKVNIFASGMYNQHKGSGEGMTARSNFFGEPLSNVTQTSNNNMNGLFANGRVGLDYFMDNRNTLTFSGMLMRGKFQPTDAITTSTDLLFPGNTLTSSYLRTSDQDRNFRNLGTSVQFKHLFPKKGAEWTADLNYNRVKFEGGSTYRTTYDDGLETREKQEALGQGSFITLQTDFVNPIGEHAKLEGGLKATMRDNKNDNANFIFSDTDSDWQQVAQISDHYKFDDDVYAAYIQTSYQKGGWGIQAGLRAESSVYKGALTDRDSSFTIAYPISLFPSVFLTRQLNEDGDQVQLAYTRRVNRPNFFQTMPFTDFSDSLNLRRGNVQLRPEFTNSLELSYQNIFSSGHNLLVSVYYKQASNLITSYQFTEYNEDLNKEVVITSFANGNSAAAYGAELTLKNSFFGWLDLTHNLNVYQQEVDATNVENTLELSRLSAFLKEVVQIKLPSGFTLQFNGEYRTKASFTPVTNNDPFRGGGFPSQNTAQGYTKAYWFVDASVRKDLMKNKASLTLSMQDVFASREMGSYTVTDFFTQDTYRLMNPQMVRLNFSYRFGKMDTALFTRKNNRVNMQGNDMMQ